MQVTYVLRVNLRMLMDALISIHLPQLYIICFRDSAAPVRVNKGSVVFADGFALSRDGLASLARTREVLAARGGGFGEERGGRPFVRVTARAKEVRTDAGLRRCGARQKGNDRARRMQWGTEGDSGTDRRLRRGSEWRQR